MKDWNDTEGFGSSPTRLQYWLPLQRGSGSLKTRHLHLLSKL